MKIKEKWGFAEDTYPRSRLNGRPPRLWRTLIEILDKNVTGLASEKQGVSLPHHKNNCKNDLSALVS